ncbi:MAG: UvrD-helicase domain-containing protein [Okeania sp. SIO3I5]|uniref:UvrD-helicase domain-containing protein n=1 Tax=Okeania sp. SIO3I5 TaxID=2607805 RepID=UPI0013B88140|nr:UvrD-helicase domain-containing protein [Okeania sp. SIO3I5]NEQ35692.1 UvrD-helicase domain-containing protein [Okeania sp. SIO3I5]
MIFLFSSKVTSKLFSWSHSPGEVKRKFADRLSKLFDFLATDLEKKDEVLNAVVNGDYYNPAIHFSKENNLILIHDFEVHNHPLDGSKKSFPAIVNQRFFKNVRAANVSSEKSLYAIGDLSTTSNKSLFPVPKNYPSSNSLGIYYDYLSYDKGTSLSVFTGLLPLSSKKVYRLKEKERIEYFKIFKRYREIEHQGQGVRSKLEFDLKPEIILRNIVWFNPSDPELKPRLNELDYETLFSLVDLKNYNFDDAIDELYNINIDDALREALEGKILDHFDVKSHDPRELLSDHGLSDREDKVETSRLSSIEESIEFWSELISAREDQNDIFSLKEDSFIRVLAGPGTGKTQLMVVRALKLINEAIDKGRRKHILFITFNNDQSEDIKQRFENLGCGEYLISSMIEKIDKIPNPKTGKVELKIREDKIQTVEVYSLYEWCRDFVELSLEGSIANLAPLKEFENTKKALETRRKILREIIRENNVEKGRRYNEEQNETLVNHCVSSITRYIIPKNITDRGRFVREAPYRNEAYRRLIWHLYNKYRAYLDNNSILDPEMFVIKADSTWRDVSFKVLREIIEYDNLFVDEVQDLLNHQRKLVGQLLKQDSKSAMIVGDPNQSVYHTAVHIRNPGDWEMKKFGLNVQLRYTKAIAKFLQSFQNHNASLEIVEDLPLYASERQNTQILPDVGPFPLFDQKSRDDLHQYVYETVSSYLNFDNPDSDSKLLPGDILVIVLPDKKAGIDDENTWETCISNLKKYLDKKGIKAKTFDGSGNKASLGFLNVVWGAENAKGKEKPVVIVLGADEGYKSNHVSILENSDLRKDEQKLIEYKEIKVAISRVQTYLHIQYFDNLHSTLNFEPI